MKANYRGIFADPRAKFCFGSVFFEGIFIHGIFPYVAILLLASGEARASIAGLVIARLRLRRRDLFAVGAGAGRSFRGATADADRRRAGRRRLLRSPRCISPGTCRSRSSACSGSASTCCTAASRCTSPTCRRPRAARPRRCIRASSSWGRRPDRWSTASAMRMAALNWLMFLGAAVVLVIAIVCARYCGSARRRRLRRRHRRLDSGLVEPHQNAHYQGIRPGVPRRSRLRAHPSNLSGSCQRREPLLMTASARFGTSPKSAPRSPSSAPA